MEYWGKKLWKGMLTGRLSSITAYCCSCSPEGHSLISKLLSIILLSQVCIYATEFCFAFSIHCSFLCTETRQSPQIITCNAAADGTEQKSIWGTCELTKSHVMRVIEKLSPNLLTNLIRLPLTCICWQMPNLYTHATYIC